jgi:hypothetical protein
METHNAEEQSSDEALNAHLAGVGPDHPGSSHDVRLERLNEYESAGGDKPDPLQALLTFTSADLMHVAFKLGDALKSTLGTAPVTGESVRQAQPVLNDYLRVTRQVDRYTQLELRLEQARIRAEDERKRAKSTKLSGHFQQSPRRLH